MIVFEKKSGWPPEKADEVTLCEMVVLGFWNVATVPWSIVNVDLVKASEVGDAEMVSEAPNA
jgi:hypothetical protein